MPKNPVCFTYIDSNNGNIQYWNGTELVPLPNGTTGQVLKTQGPEAEPIWITPYPPRNPPTDITLSNNSIEENSSIGTIIGTLTAVNPELDPIIFTIQADPDNKFAIVNDELRVNNTLNYETTTSHSVTIRATNSVNPNAYFDKIFTINVTNIDENITNITLSNNSIEENSSIGTVIGTLTATDPESDPVTFTIQLDPDNKFALVGNELRLNGALDYGTATSHPVTIRATQTNNASLYFDKVLTVNVIDVNVLTRGNYSTTNILGYDRGATCQMDATHAIVCWNQSATVNVAVATRSGSSVTLGTAITVETNFPYVQLYASISICKMDATHAMLTVGSGGIGTRAMILTMSGTSLTAGTALNISNVAIFCTLVAMTSTHAILSYSSQSLSSVYSVCLEMSGTSVVQYTAINSAPSNGTTIDLIRFDDNYALFMYTSFSQSSKSFVRVLNLSGTTITLGTPVEIHGSYAGINSMTSMDSTHALITIYDSTDGNKGKIRIATRNGMDVSINSYFTFENQSTNYMTIGNLSSTQAIVCYAASSNAWAKYVEFNGSNAVTYPEARIQLTTSSSDGIEITDPALDANNAICMVSQGNNGRVFAINYTPL